MAEILTTRFRTDATRFFVDDVLNNDYYVFVSGIANTEPVNSLFSENEFLENTLFGKKILNEDVFFMIRYYPWQKDQVYVPYDDRADLEDQKFYAVVGPNNNDTGDYRVYKCLDNNSGAKVETPPNYDPATQDQIYRTADGYVWKFLYSITDLEFEAYNAIGYIPITGTFNTDPTPGVGGKVSNVLVENPDLNFGYVEEIGGMVLDPETSGRLTVRQITEFNPLADYYVGQYIYITNSDSSTHLFEIEDYEVDTSSGETILIVGHELISGDTSSNPASVGVQSNATFKIFPKVEIAGDGSGAVAIPEIVNNSIKSITVLNEGSGYTNVTARIVDPIYDFAPEDPTTTDIRAELRAVISPVGGHGYDLLDELKCKHFLLYGYIKADENLLIGATNTYTGVGVVRKPQFSGASPEVFDNRITVATSNIDRVVLNGIVTQQDADGNVTFSAKVHDIDLANNLMFLAEYMGPYPNNTDPSTGAGNYDTSIDISRPFINETGQTITINSPAVSNVIMPSYVQRSGEVYFMEDFLPLPRNELSREEFKFVLEF